MTEETVIIDINAWTGHWGTYPVKGGVEQVRKSLRGMTVKAPLSPASLF